MSSDGEGNGAARDADGVEFEDVAVSQADAGQVEGDGHAVGAGNGDLEVIVAGGQDGVDDALVGQTGGDDRAVVGAEVDLGGVDVGGEGREVGDAHLGAGSGRHVVVDEGQEFEALVGAVADGGEGVVDAGLEREVTGDGDGSSEPVGTISM